MYFLLIYNCVKEFLKKEYCQENIVFWLKCENYKKLPEEQV